MKSVCSYLRLIIKCCILRSCFGIFVVFSFVASGMLRLNIHRNTSDVFANRCTNSRVSSTGTYPGTSLAYWVLISVSLRSPDLELSVVCPLTTTANYTSAKWHHSVRASNTDSAMLHSRGFSSIRRIFPLFICTMNLNCTLWLHATAISYSHSSAIWDDTWNENQWFLMWLVCGIDVCDPVQWSLINYVRHVHGMCTISGLCLLLHFF